MKKKLIAALQITILLFFAILISIPAQAGDISVGISADKTEYTKDSDNFINLEITFANNGLAASTFTAAIIYSQEGKEGTTSHTPVTSDLIGSGETNTQSAPIGISGFQPGVYTFSALTPIQDGEDSSSNNFAKVSVVVLAQKGNAVPEIPFALVAVVAVGVMLVLGYRKL